MVMDYSSCCRLCLQNLIGKDCKKEYFTTDEIVSDERSSTLQEIIAECFQIIFSDDESITKVCENCFNDVQLVDGIRRRFLAADDLVKRYYSQVVDIKPVVLDIGETYLGNNGIEDSPALEQIEDQVEEEYLVITTHSDGELMQDECLMDLKIDQAKLVVETIRTPTKGIRRRRGKRTAKFTCYICQTDFATLLELDQHLPSHVGTISQVCKLCNFQVTTVRHLNMHLQRTHFRTGDRIPCDICEESGTILEFSSNYKLQDHIKRVHEGIVEIPKATFVCSYCGKSFNRASHLKAHENNIHTKAIIFHCNFCTKYTATSRSAILRHERIHTAEKPFKCDECDAAFTQSNALRLHKTGVHSDERPFACTLCDARFKGKYVLQRHLQLHEKHPNGTDMRKRSANGCRKKRIRSKKATGDANPEANAVPELT